MSSTRTQILFFILEIIIPLVWMLHIHLPQPTYLILLSGDTGGSADASEYPRERLDKGGSGDPGARSIVGRARARTSGIRYIY
jgi:hypothetical protein